MQPQDLVNNLQDIQLAANRISISSAGVSHAIGDMLEFLGSGEDLVNMPKYAKQLSDCIRLLTEALEDYAKIALRMDRGDGHE